MGLDLLRLLPERAQSGSGNSQRIVRSVRRRLHGKDFAPGGKWHKGMQVTVHVTLSTSQETSPRASLDVFTSSYSKRLIDYLHKSLLSALFHCDPRQTCYNAGP
jgi:hypothetical protein